VGAAEAATGGSGSGGTTIASPGVSGNAWLPAKAMK